jgi:hypothetical protein
VISLDGPRALVGIDGSVSVVFALATADRQVTMTGAGDLLVSPLNALRAQREWTSVDVADPVRRRSGLNVAARWERVWRRRSPSDSGAVIWGDR